MPKQEEQEMTLDRALWFGRMCREYSVSTKAEISPQSSKKQSVSQSQKLPIFQYLATDGLLPDATWETDGQLLGEFSTLSIGESPSVAVESRLSQILEANPHPKYCLSPKACQGILNRAERRGKELPEMLRTALEMQSQDKKLGERTGLGISELGAPAYTITAEHEHAVAYGICSYESNAMKSDNPNSGIYEADTSRTLDNNGGNPACNQGGIAVVCLNDQGGSVMEVSHDVTGTIRAQEHGHQPIAVYENHAQDSRYGEVGDTAPTCTARYGTGGGQHADSC